MILAGWGLRSLLYVVHMLPSSVHAAGQTVTYDVPYFSEQLGELVVGNKEPFCAELFNRYGLPFAFQPLSIKGLTDGFPVWVSVESHEVRGRPPPTPKHFHTLSTLSSSGSHAPLHIGR